MILHSHQTAYQNCLDRKERLPMYELSKGDQRSHQDKSCGVIFLIYSYTVDENVLCVWELPVCNSAYAYMCTVVCTYVEARRLPQWYHHPVWYPSLLPPPFLLSLISFQAKAYHWPGEICLSVPHQPWDLNVDHHAPLLCEGGFCGWNSGLRVWSFTNRPTSRLCTRYALSQQWVFQRNRDSRFTPSKA